VQFHEPERFAEYAQLMFPALLKYNALPIAHIDPAGVTGHTSNVEIVDGTWPGITTVIQFPSRAKLEEFYNSAEYSKRASFAARLLPQTLDWRNNLPGPNPQWVVISAGDGISPQK
jgi:uncharacterized protein (DUF1330 family)